MGDGDRVPDPHGPGVRRRTPGVHPAVRRAGGLDAGRDDQPPGGRDRDGVDGAGPVPHGRVAPTRARRRHRPGRQGDAVSRTGPGHRSRRRTDPRRQRRRLAGQRRRLLRRAAARRPARVQPPRPVHRRRRRPVPLPHGRAPPLPDPGRRPGRRAARRHGPACLPARPPAPHRVGARLPARDHARLRRRLAVPRLRRGLRGQGEPGPRRWSTASSTFDVGLLRDEP